VRRVGFALDEPYVEEVWVGVIGPSVLLALRRLPVLWREREPALVDLRELGQSLGLGPSLARSGRMWRTIERLVGFGMAHWLLCDELGVRTDVAPLCGRQLARVLGCTRQVHDRLVGMHLDRLALAHTDRTLGPPRPVPRDRPPRPPPVPPPRHHPRPRPPTMTVPRSPDVAQPSSPAGPPPSSPTDRPSAHTLAGAPAGHLLAVPRAHLSHLDVRDPRPELFTELLGHIPLPE
jgi:hypothetical protein